MRVPRKITGIAATEIGIIAVADDGSAWFATHGASAWRELLRLPDREEPDSPTERALRQDTQWKRAYILDKARGGVDATTE